jgi:hypothetical protein
MQSKEPNSACGKAVPTYFTGKDACPGLVLEARISIMPRRAWRDVRHGCAPRLRRTFTAQQAVFCAMIVTQLPYNSTVEFTTQTPLFDIVLDMAVNV